MKSFLANVYQQLQVTSFGTSREVKELGMALNKAIGTRKIVPIAY